MIVWFFYKITLAVTFLKFDNALTDSIIGDLIIAKRIS